MEEPGAAGSQAAPKGRAKACTSCRQVKLKCDAKEVYPNPCSRCKAQNLECRMDPSFKRVPARRQLEEVSNQLINLQRSLGLDKDSSLPSMAGGSAIPRLDRLPEHPESELFRRPSAGQDSAESFSHSESQIGFLNLQDELKEGQWTIGDITLSYHQVLPLFEHFDKVLSRHVPFLQTCTSLHELYKSSDILFWTIIFASCRLFNSYHEMYLQMIPHHRTLLSMRIFTSRVTLGSIHALLLLCNWPYPVNSQYDDITWTLCGVAINLSTVIGLHKPHHGHEYVLNELDPVAGSPYVRNMTWMACFQISTSIASWLGLPPTICSTSHLETLDSLCQDPNLLKSYRAKVEIQRQISRIINALDAKLDFRTRYSLIKLYEQDLDRVHTAFEDAWTKELEVDWLGAKLFLFGMAFLPSGAKLSESESISRATGAREILQYGLSAATKMLSSIAEFKVPHTSPGENRTSVPDFVYQLAFYPKHLFRVGAFAAFFLIWYLAVDVNASEADRILARDHVSFVYQLFFAIKHSPEHLRAGKSIEMLARFESMAPKNRQQTAHLLVNSRLGASFMYSLNYTEEDEMCRFDNTEQRLLDQHPALLSVDPPTVAAALEASHDSSTPSHTTGASSISRWLSDRGTESPQSSHFATGSEPSQYQQPQQPLAIHQQQQQQQQQQQPPPPPLPLSPNAAAAVATGPVNTQTGNVPMTTAFVTPDGRVPQQFDPNIFSNAFFQGVPNQNFEFLWQDWDPAVFEDLKMDVDEQLTTTDHTDDGSFLG